MEYVNYEIEEIEQDPAALCSPSVWCTLNPAFFISEITCSPIDLTCVSEVPLAMTK